VRKIDKASQPIPDSLNSDLTKQRRQELIDNSPKGYIYEGKYDSRYKYPDIKEALEKIYLNKCAYCETKVERWDVEHFRPKSIYYWLVYSWDNLLLACPTCNSFKNNHFEILENRVEYQTEDLSSIHSLIDSYNQREKNLFFNPELEDPEPKIRFEKENGMVFSNDPKLQYTIKTCDLNRPYLIGERQKVWDDFYNKIKSCLLEYQSTKDENLRVEIRSIVKYFKQESEDLTNVYTGFRRYIVKHFLNEK
jgi:uncharacterized protein (TIGR02646 family)